MKEKIIVPIILIVLMFIMFLYVRSCNKHIEKEGGVRTIIVNIGKEIKSIGKDINE